MGLREPSLGRTVVRLVSTHPLPGAPAAGGPTGSGIPTPHHRRRTLYRPWVVGPAILSRSPHALAPDGRPGLWQVDVSDDGRLLPLAPGSLADIQQVVEFRRSLGVACRVAASLLVPTDMPPTGDEPAFPPARASVSRRQRQPRLPVEIYGWALLYQLPQMRHQGVIDPHETFADLPAFYESPVELVDRSVFLSARGILHRPLALLTFPEDFGPADTDPARCNRFATDASPHRTCRLQDFWPD